MSNRYSELTAYELRHLPSHLGGAACWEELQWLLTDLEFQQTRLGALPGSEPAAAGIYDVLRDFTDVLAALPAEATGRAGIEALYRVFDQQAHLLREQPRWFVQQVANACDWDQTPLADNVREAERHCVWPRLRLRNRPALSRILAFKRVLAGHEAGVTCVAWSPDSSLLATSSHDRTLRLWDSVTGAERRCLQGHGDVVWTVSFSPDGRTLASGSRDDTIRLWDVATGAELCCLRGHKGMVYAVSFSPVGHVLASASWDKTVRLWDVGTGAELRCLQGRGHPEHFGVGTEVKAVSFAADGFLLGSV